MLATIKKGLALSTASYKHLPHLNLVLGLMTLRANKLDSEARYVEIIKQVGSAS